VLLHMVVVCLDVARCRADRPHFRPPPHVVWRTELLLPRLPTVRRRRRRHRSV